MSCAKKAASNDAVGCKTARACDSCVKKRARWYCAADDAFLCQACDHSVHTANSLARRHDRVRLKTASHKDPHAPPAWHQGFTRKARTPRGGAKGNLRREPASFPVVPELGGDNETNSLEENGDEQLLYTVPIADELFTASGSSDGAREVLMSESCGVDFDGGLGLHGFLPTEMDLEEFSADVESLLGRGLENECDFGIEGLGFLDCEEKGFGGFDGRVKVEDEDEAEQEVKNANSMSCWAETSMEIDMTRPEPLELNFDDYDESPASCGDEEDDRKAHILSVGTAETQASNVTNKNCEEDSKKSKKKKKKRKIMLLSLNYEAVITEWASQGSPWTTGDRPEFDLDATWPNCMDTTEAPMLQHNHHQPHFMGLSGGNSTVQADGGREARMSRYREKRRNRWFSKKIRYEVRKLNAEKRPRMKGRFVKQASFATPK